MKYQGSPHKILLLLKYKYGTSQYCSSSSIEIPGFSAKNLTLYALHNISKFSLYNIMSADNFMWWDINFLISTSGTLTLSCMRGREDSHQQFVQILRPPSLVFLKCVILGFWSNHLQTVHDYRSHAKGGSQRLKIEDFMPFKKILNFLKKSDKFITQSNFNHLKSIFF